MNYIKELCRQSADKLIMLFIISIGAVFTSQIPDIFSIINKKDVSGFATIFLTILFFTISLSALFALAAGTDLIPSRKRILKNINVSQKTTNIKLPNLLCFKENGELLLANYGGKELEPLLIKEINELDGFHKINKDKINIKIKDKENNLIPIVVNTFLFGGHFLSIKFQNKEDISKADTISLQAENNINFNLSWNCFNKKAFQS